MSDDDGDDDHMFLCNAKARIIIIIIIPMATPQSHNIRHAKSKIRASEKAFIIFLLFLILKIYLKGVIAHDLLSIVA